MIEVIVLGADGRILCDLCSEDYTNNNEAVGGFLFGSYAVCPKCAPRYLETIKSYNEERYISGKAGENETFRDFVLRLRAEPKDPYDN